MDCDHTENLIKNFLKSIIFLSKSQIKLSNKAFTAIGLLDLSITFLRFQTINHINCVFPFQFYNQQKLLSDFVMWPALWIKCTKIQVYTQHLTSMVTCDETGISLWHDLSHHIQVWDSYKRSKFLIKICAITCSSLLYFPQV